ARSAHKLRSPEMELGLQIASRIEHAIRGEPKEASEATDRDRLHRLAVLDGLAGIIPNAAGHLNNRLDTLRLDQLLSDAAKASIQASRPLGRFPPRLRENIEALRLMHEVERDVEGSIHTPSWFTRHHAARLLSVDIRTTYESLLNWTEQWSPSQAESLRKQGAVEAAVMVVQRGLESVSKLDAAADLTKSRLEELNECRVKAAGGEWPDVTPEEWKERLGALRLVLIKELVRLTPLLPTTPPRKDLPDSFGFAYTTLCNAAIEALMDMDAETFEFVYPILVRSALKAHNRVTAELAEIPDESVLYFSADVILDVMEISGYAYFWKFGLGEECFWDNVTGVWDQFLSRYPRAADLIRLITFEEDYHKGRFAISPRTQNRFHWRSGVRQLLRDKGFAPRDVSSDTAPEIIPIDPTAASYLLAWQSRRARELMLSEYLLERPEVPGIDLPRGVADLREGAKRVSDNRASGRVEGGPGFTGGIS
ncbi:MAG: hypothetical protein OXH38_09845, partial [Chloroflexi bacterium]|nr:hypothetical protein [Chloroflexota bacterium]